MVSVKLIEGTKRFGKTTALDHVDLEIRSGEFFFLLGPSGCGKTTLLRAVAGLGLLDEGDVFFDDRKMNNVPPHKRNTSLVFQNYALWPHMSVFDNVAYGLVERKVPKEKRKKMVSDVLELVRLEHIAQRRPSEMSGGQQQRVALARALVVEPDVVLLDEPLSNLDAHLRNEMRYELKRIQSETGVTMIYVTHDQKEALAMAHTIAVLKDGRLHQVGTPENLYQNPEDIFVAEFVGRTNILKGKILQLKDPYLSLETPIGNLWGRRSCKNDEFQTGEEIVCSIRPEAVRTTTPLSYRLSDSPTTSSSACAPSSPQNTTEEKDNNQDKKENKASGQGEPPHTEITAKLAKRLFMGEYEERFYKANGIELQAIEHAPRGSPPSPDASFRLFLSPHEVIVLKKETKKEDKQ